MSSADENPRQAVQQACPKTLDEDAIDPQQHFSAAKTFLQISNSLLARMFDVRIKGW